MDVQAAKALVEEDAFAPRGFQDDDAIIAEQRSLDLDDRKGKARASLDLEDEDDDDGQGNGDGRRLLGRSNGAAGKKHVRLMDGGVVLEGGGGAGDEDEDEVPRRSMNGGRGLGRRRGPRLSKAARRRAYWRDAMINVLFILSWSVPSCRPAARPIGLRGRPRYFFATLISLYSPSLPRSPVSPMLIPEQTSGCSRPTCSPSSTPSSSPRSTWPSSSSSPA